MNNLVKHAHHYIALGFSILPLKPRDKVPALKSWFGKQNSKMSAREIPKWWGSEPELNIGIVCGTVSGIVVVDIDDQDKLPKDLHFPPTASVRTSRGFHSYYRLKPDQKIKTQKFPWGEIRGEGAYVVAPYSIHPSGAVYEWAGGDLPSIEDMDYFPAELLEQASKESATKLYESAFSSVVTEGARNSTMASVIGKLLKTFPNRAEWPTTVWEIVKDVNTKRCVPPLPTDELEQIFNSICKSEVGSPTKNDESKTFRIMTGKEIVKLNPTQKPYLIDRMIYERGINAITADSGKGKSLLALIIAKSLSTGERLFDQLESKKTKVLVIDQEMDEDLIVERYKEIIGTDDPQIDYLYEQSWAINEQRDYEWLKQTITERGYGCIVFDTLTNIHTYDENKAEDMRELNKLFLQLIRDTDVSIIYLHHHRKLQKGEKMNQASSRGSTEIVAKMSSHLLLDSKQDKDDLGRTITSMTIKQSKSRRPDRISNMAVDVIHDPATKVTTWKFQGEVKDNISASQRATDEILKLLKENGEMTINELYEESSVGKSSVREGVKILVKNNLIDFDIGKTGLKVNTKVYFLRKAGDY